MAEHDQGTQELLQSALSTAFTPTDLPRASVSPPPQPALPPEPPAPAASAEAPGSDAYDAWKAEYEAQVAQWRAANIEQRAKAERERERWERIRAEERAQREKEGVEAREEWPTLTQATGSASVPRGDSPSPADVRDLVSGEKEGHHRHAEAPHMHQHSKETSSLSASQKWEDLPSSMNSSQSYPSMSFPSLSNPETPPDAPQPHHRPGHSHHQTHGHLHSQQRGTEAQHVTLSVFDSTLPTKTRALALVSSLGINFLLPFVNGVMLGFGEIFAKEVVVGWFGWGRGWLERNRAEDSRELEARRRR
ncbi:hypothetical protein GLOTRDRAFT_111601 [Gloeophyllum trabeum ATCC 11539]|uniref:TOM13-domain-containing protein n=1 Tax=Gloeophyllum trabeum (strain ATCC 11539 / FP-39264 / Madison 617) TaxID=670483 RepID=S7RIT2_GLOTA|nr:uncharacterized protein GLOTRDRAFT_111601 [Gloeophyllum trabeum ATCC 11539]EPQ54260.1 hypothetical protein GLOTRDRAFT_111601 [Gloeophyllum trabeum ATCC 11539]